MWTADNNRQASSSIFVSLMAALILLAWLSLWLSGRSGHHGFLHSLHNLDAFGGAGFAIVFIVGWTVMIVAMMLPTSLPLIVMFRALTRQRRDRALLTALLVTGYLATWALFGVIVYGGGWLLQEAAGRSAWLGANAWVLGAGVLGLAGAYQFTPLKYHCLDKCRSPLSFVTEHWRGSREWSQSFRLGVHHGLFCVGCCWSLMLLMFLVGAGGALLWMLALGAVMAVEKNAKWGRRIGVPLGVLLVGAGMTLGTAQALQPPEKTTDETNAGATAKVSLAPAGDSGVSGVAAFADTADGMRVELRTRGLPDTRETYLAHLHPGSCADDPADGAHGSHGNPGRGDHHEDAAESVGEIEHPLEPIVPASGGAASVTTIEGATVARLFSGDPGYYVNVHAEASGSEELPTLACGDLLEGKAKAPGHDEGHHDH